MIIIWTLSLSYSLQKILFPFFFGNILSPCWNTYFWQAYVCHCWHYLQEKMFKRNCQWSIKFSITCSVRTESKTMLDDSGLGAFQTWPSTSASIDGTMIPVSGATVGALNACKFNQIKITIYYKISIYYLTHLIIKIIVSIGFI